MVFYIPPTLHFSVEVPLPLSWTLHGLVGLHPTSTWLRHWCLKFLSYHIDVRFIYLILKPYQCLVKKESGVLRDSTLRTLNKLSKYTLLPVLIWRVNHCFETLLRGILDSSSTTIFLCWTRTFVLNPIHWCVVVAQAHNNYSSLQRQVEVEDANVISPSERVHSGECHKIVAVLRVTDASHL